MMKEYEIWLNGKYYPRSQAKISMLDRGFKLSDLVYDTLRTFDGKVYRLDDHMDRLERSLHYVRINPGLSITEIANLILEVIDHNEPLRSENGDDYMISPIITRGVGYRLKDVDNKSSISIFIDPIDFDFYSLMHKQGAHGVISKARSFSSEQLDPKVKHFSRLSYVMADIDATDVDPKAFPIMLDMDGNIAESVGANIMIVKDGVVKTPKDTAILQGISRKAIIETATNLGIDVIEEDLQPYDLYTADEAFFTSTPFCLIPISKIDKREITDQIPGPVTAQLLAAWSESIGLDIVDQTLKLGNNKK
ncbi:MAG: branched-chain amino acid aminotransferase [Dehalococcoidia bacterium]|nr:branched-chain amino acid aminotransferase [Dehalococcoidia bacterium]MQG15313.1 branched-chain amino acid aminotransferase [SAR202 cluster bacterium]|tara:strand:- start:33664 stop:34584 length:921 start_codon:yes stop_codon:yes gene_type:complete